MNVHRVCVIFLPSSQEHMWRAAFRVSAETAGWRVVDGSSEEACTESNDKGLLVQLADGARIAEFDPTSVLIVMDRPSAAVDALMASFGISFVDAVKSVAHYYTDAVPAAEQGARIADVWGERIDVPGLGGVSRATVAPRNAVFGAADPMAFYSCLPPQLGAQAAWPAEIFTWNSESPGLVDLTGRRRLLQHGPYVELCAGTWKIDLHFALRMESGRCELRFEWGSGADCTVHSELLERSGTYHLSLQRTWPESGIAELRIWLDRAMFDGTLEVLDCVVSRAS